MKKLKTIVAVLACLIAANTYAEKKADFWSVVKNRTSVRQWEDKPVAKADIEDLLRAAMSAPTAVNKQPWRFLVITDAAERNALADKVERGGMYRDAPVLIVVCGDMDAALEGEAREYWVQDCSAATENLLLAVTAKGLGAVWTGVYPIQKRTQALQQALGLPQNIIPLNFLPLVNRQHHFVVAFR